MSFKFEKFNRVEVAFKSIGSTPLQTSILFPKSVKKGKCPLLVHFHGGGLMVGDRLFGDWYPLWLCQFAEAQGAIIVSPDYRLIPEADGSDILEDVKDFWDWVKASLPAHVSDASSGLSVDLTRIAVAGESGYLSLQSAFLFPDAGIKLVMCQYATLDVDHPAYNPPPRQRPAAADASIVDKYLKNMKAGAIRLSSIPPDRWDLCTAILSEGRHRELIGQDERMRLRQTLRQAKEIPPIWFAQGNNDIILPQEVAEDFVKRVRKQFPKVPIHFNIQPGPHGFDTASTIDETWVQEGMSFSRKFW